MQENHQVPWEENVTKLDKKQKIIIAVTAVIVAAAVSLTVVFVKRSQNKKAAELLRNAELSRIAALAETYTESTTEDTTAETETETAPETTHKIISEPKTKPVGTTVPVTREEAATKAPPKQEKPAENAKILDVPFIKQTNNYYSACESIASVMALNYSGYNISLDSFIDDYLPKGPSPFKDKTGTFFTASDPYERFMGDPRTNKGWGCYSPVIKGSLNRIINSSRNRVVDLGGSSMSSLCKYIDDGVPVIMWATVNMSPVSKTRELYLTYDDRSITWKSPNHCLLLVGYDSGHYYFNDSLQSKNFAYSKASVEKAYRANGSQALAIVKYSPPVVTTEPVTESTTELTTETQSESTTETPTVDTTAN